VDLDKWVTNYILSRYGKIIKEVELGWKLLQHSVYNCTVVQSGPSGVFLQYVLH